MNFGTKYAFFGPKRGNWDHLGSNMADNWLADQLIWSVGLGARAVSRKTPIYFIYLISSVCHSRSNYSRPTLRRFQAFKSAKSKRTTPLSLTMRDFKKSNNLKASQLSVTASILQEKAENTVLGKLLEASCASHHKIEFFEASLDICKTQTS